MEKELILAWTRDFTLCWAEWWQKYMHPRLVESIGEGVEHQLSFFNGKLLETYRPKNEAKRFIDAVVSINPKTGFFEPETLKKFTDGVKEARRLITQAHERGVYADKKTFAGVHRLSAETYPWYTVCYLLPRDEWAPMLIEKYPNDARAILDRLIAARHACEGVIEEFVDYWRKTTRELLSERGMDASFSEVVTYTELERMIADTKYRPEEKQLRARKAGYLFYCGTVATGIGLPEFIKQQGYIYTPVEPITKTSEVKGTVACTSAKPIRGLAQIILRADEVPLFKAGNILVTVMTSPFFVPAMKKAAAIVTDEGGITCHAAIVSRELKVPCVIGTKAASKIFKDGDILEVDTDNGLVKRLQ